MLTVDSVAPLRRRVDAFSRFGGYAASFTTGLVGFLQILRDASRQGLHDRIGVTVVRREGGDRDDVNDMDDRNDRDDEDTGEADR